MENAEIGIIGGTGIYDPGLLDDIKELSIETPYGAPSEKITVGQYNGKKVAFIPRHGKKHTILPHMINYRANIWALKELGVKRIVSPSAVGSLKEDLPPGSFVLPSQFVDFTKTRNGSFAKNGDVFHISTADPFCPQMEDVILEAAKKTGLKMHTGKSYVCIEGPRFSTRAESNFFRTAVNADIIGMTLAPECHFFAVVLPNGYLFRWGTVRCFYGELFDIIKVIPDHIFQYRQLFQSLHFPSSIPPRHIVDESMVVIVISRAPSSATKLS